MSMGLLPPKIICRHAEPPCAVHTRMGRSSCAPALAHFWCACAVETITRADPPQFACAKASAVPFRGGGWLAGALTLRKDAGPASREVLMHTRLHTQVLFDKVRSFLQCMSHVGDQM